MEARLFYYFEPFLTAFDHLQKGLQTLVEPGFLAYEKLNSQGNLSGALKPEQITWTFSQLFPTFWLSQTTILTSFSA